MDKNKGSDVIFDDMFGARNSSQTNEFFTKGRHEDLKFHTIKFHSKKVSQSLFALLRQINRNKSDIIKLFEQSSRDVESMNKNIGGYDMSHCGIKEMCHDAWEKNNYLCIDMTKIKLKVSVVFSMKAKTHIPNAPPKQSFFEKHNYWI